MFLHRGLLPIAELKELEIFEQNNKFVLYAFGGSQSEPPNPENGNYVQWMDKDTGEVKIKRNFNGIISTVTLL